MARRETLTRMLVALGVTVLCAADMTLAASSIRASLEAWALYVVPAMLPFLFAVPALTCAEAAALLSGALAPVMRWIGCPGEWGAAYLTGILSGSPGGALASARSAAQTSGDRGALLRLSIAASGASPAFLGGVAGALLGGASGWALIASQGLGALVTARLMRPLRGERVMEAERQESRGESALLFAARTLVMIGICMALFALPAAWCRRLFGEKAESVCLMLLELSGGCRAVAGLDVPMPLKSMLMSAVCAFGGASVCAQCLGALRPMGIGAAEYVCWKMVHAALSALFMRAMTLLLGNAVWPGPGMDGCLALLCVTVMALFAALLRRRFRRQNA